MITSFTKIYLVTPVIDVLCLLERPFLADKHIQQPYQLSGSSSHDNQWITTRVGGRWRRYFHVLFFDAKLNCCLVEGTGLAPSELVICCSTHCHWPWSSPVPVSLSTSDGTS